MATRGNRKKTKREDFKRRDIALSCRLLNDMIGDIYAAIYLPLFVANHLTHEAIHPLRRDSLAVNVPRICITHLALSLVKCQEWVGSYSELLPDELIPRCHDLLNQIKRRMVNEVRDQIAGHLRDKRGRPVPRKVAEEYFNRVINDDPDGFARWIGRDNPEDPNSVIGLLLVMRDAVKARFDITDAEVYELGKEPK